jgi:hypothetical protein
MTNRVHALFRASFCGTSSNCVLYILTGKYEFIFLQENMSFRVFVGMASASRYAGTMK